MTAALLALMLPVAAEKPVMSWQSVVAVTFYFLFLAGDAILGIVLTRNCE